MAPNLIQRFLGILSGNSDQKKRKLNAINRDLSSNDHEIDLRLSKRVDLCPAVEQDLGRSNSTLELASPEIQTGSVSEATGCHSNLNENKPKISMPLDGSCKINCFTWRELPPPKSRNWWKEKTVDGRAQAVTQRPNAILTVPNGETNVEIKTAGNIINHKYKLEFDHERDQDVQTVRLPYRTGLGGLYSRNTASEIARQSRWDKTDSANVIDLLEEKGSIESHPTSDKLTERATITLMAKLEAQLMQSSGASSTILLQKARERRRQMEHHEEMSRAAIRRASSILDESRQRTREEEAIRLAERLEAFRIQRTSLKGKPKRPVELTDEDRKTYERSINSNNVSVSHPRSRIDIRSRDIKKLGRMNWLNDEIINLYLALLQERDTERRSITGPKCHFFNTYFVNKLYSDSGVYNYDEVKRWTTPKRLRAWGQASSSILDCDKIIIPVNQNMNHWICAVIDIEKKELVLYDSLGGRNEELLCNLARYLADEFRNKRNEERTDILQWPKKFPKEIPRQENCYDCGVFTLLFAEYLSRGVIFDFTQRDIDDFRIKILNEILELKIR